MSTTKTTEAKLDAAVTAQFIFKNSIMRRLAILIAKKAIASPAFYPDEVEIDWLQKVDAKCVGQTYRLLMRLNIISRTGHHRRSLAKNRSGGEIWQYRCQSLALARTFLDREGQGGITSETQMDLLTPPPSFPK